MAQDDVTNPAPLKGGRQRANHIQVHRIELGLTERKMLKQSFWVTVGPPILAVVAAGVGTGLAGYAVYQFFKEGPFADIFSQEWRDANLLPVVNYDSSQDPTGQGRGYWEVTWANLVKAFTDPWFMP